MMKAEYMSMDRSTRPALLSARRPSVKAKRRAAALLALIIIAWMFVLGYLILHPFIIWERAIKSNEIDQEL